MWNERQAMALQAVFSTLNENRLEWLVLRNYEGLPRKNSAKDIDIMVSKHDFAYANKIVCDIMKNHRFDIHTESQYPYAHCFTFFNLSEELLCSIKIDLLDSVGFMWRGARVVDFADLYPRKVSYGDFFVPDPIYNGFMLWIKPLMSGGFIKEKYRGDIVQILKESPVEFYELLIKTFQSRVLKTVWEHLANGSIDATIKFKNQLCHAAWLVAMRNNPVRTISGIFEILCRGILRRTCRPKASMLAVIGPDGSGKSTFIEQLQEDTVKSFL
jgi:hypothetical protein